MSEIPKNKRSVSPLEAQHQSYKIRTLLTQELIMSFAYNEKKEESHISKTTSYIKDQEEKENVQNTLKSMEYGFDVWIVQEERSIILNLCRGIVHHLTRANTIYPTYMNEFEERRIELDRAMGCCNQLQQELQYLAEILPSDKNKYMNIVLEIEKEFQIIKNLRQSDNKFLKNIKK